MEPQTQATIRVAIVSSYGLLRAGLRLLVERHHGMYVVGEASNSAEALELAAQGRPDVIVLDPELIEEEAAKLIPALRSASRTSRVLLLVGELNRTIQARAVRLGVMGVVQKNQPPEVLIKAISRIHAGEVWVDRATVSLIVGDLKEREAAVRSPEELKISTITSREREVVSLIGQGCKNREIAERLAISETTVRHHLSSIFDKLGVPDRLGLIIYAYRHGLAQPPA